MEDVELDLIEDLRQQIEILQFKLDAERKDRIRFEQLYGNSVQLFNKLNITSLDDTGVTQSFFNMQNGKTISETPAEAIERVRRIYVKGQHLEIFEKLINENDLVRHEWNRFTASLRLCGYDEYNPE